MIKILNSKKESKKLETFKKIQWKLADIEHYGKELWKAKKFVYTAEEGGQIIGYIGFEIAAGVCHIEALLIAQDKRRSGVGRRLMEKAEKVAEINRVHKIFLNTGKNWQSAKFYQAMGYQVAVTFINHYGNQDFVQYIKFLTY